MHKTIDNFFIEHGKLYRLWVQPRAASYQNNTYTLLAIPRKFRPQVLRLHHDAKFGGGHFAAEKTYEKMRTRCTWPHMAVDVHAYCKSCRECQLNQKPRDRRGPCEPLSPPNRRWGRVGMDLVGPFPVTDKGNVWIQMG